MKHHQASQDQLSAWVRSTPEGARAFATMLASDKCKQIEDFFNNDAFCTNEINLRLKVEYAAVFLDYPGDGKWGSGTENLRDKTEAEIQVQDLSIIVRKLLKHVPDDVVFKEKAREYLERKGLTGSVLRSMEMSDAQE
jgi:hypothetical protein